MNSHMTSSPTLVVIEHGTMAVTSMSRTKRTDALSTSVVVEDRGKDIGHDDDEVG